MKLFVVGLGPGGAQYLTPQARDALAQCTVIIGYNTYIDLIRDSFPDKELLSTPMTQETARCRMALERTAAGETVAVVSSGDPGVYGMAGLICELAPEYPAVEVEIVAGVTAACSGAALLGAPLTHDFAVISLSDLLTPWETIERRLDAAAAADFCICLYNPMSRRRVDTLRRACDILLRHRPPENAAGIVRNVGRADEHSAVLTLGELREYVADMFTTVFVGNSQTRAIDGRLVTPRGYEK